MIAEVLERRVVQDHTAVKQERWLQHATVDLLVVVRLRGKYDRFVYLFFIGHL